LPFEVLPGIDGRRLISDYSMSYLSCARDVLRFGGNLIDQPGQPLVAADPDYDLVCDTSQRSCRVGESRKWSSRDLDRSHLHFEPLSYARLEGDRIAEFLAVKPWQGDAVLEGRLKAACRSPRILHLATHGFFLEDVNGNPNQEGNYLAETGDLGGNHRLSGSLPANPLLRSGLALAGANTWLHGGDLPDEAEDGLLTAEDVSGLDLLGTELVVLSACDTGLGDVRAGEGVFGLRRAFVLAGTKTLVMSLWKVPDKQTYELMEDFYLRVLAGQGRADALHGAQLTMSARYPDPYFWGAFICQGDPGPLGNPDRSPGPDQPLAISHSDARGWP